MLVPADIANSGNVADASSILHDDGLARGHLLGSAAL